jgi:hypothetical protein
MTEPVPRPSGQATVLLDIGAETGALVLHVQAGLDGREIEISPQIGGARTHSQVRQRHVAGTVRYAAVYPGLPAGDYLLWRDEVTPAATVTINGGEVTSMWWPDTA